MHESTVPPSYPPPRDWACPSGSSVPEEDDQEVTFPGGGRVPTRPQPQPVSPAPAGPDMGQLISALTLGLQIGTPKISTFSGNMAPGKTEVSYEQWSHEVQCIKDHYPEVVVQREHHEIPERSSSRHGLLYGPYCWCLRNFGEAFCNFWHCCIF